MTSTFKQIIVGVLKETSKGISLHSPVCFFIQILSNLEMIFMIISGITLVKSHDSDSEVSIMNVNHIISYIGSFSLFDPFTENSGLDATFYISAIYFFCYLSILIYITFQVSRQKKTNQFVLKIFAFTRLVHSRVLFYLFHGFFMKFESLYAKCADLEEPFAYCQTSKAIIIAVLAVINVCAAFAQELYCYQIQKTKNTDSIKDNVHPLLLLLHKASVLPLIHFLDSSNLVAAILNVVGSLLNLLILQLNLPFYNLNMLKLSIIFATISSVISFGFIGELVTNEGNLMLILLLALPLSVKGSLVLLNRTLLEILKLNLNDPVQAVHLPIILKECLRDLSNFPIKKELSKGTFFLYGFLQKEMSDILMLGGTEAVKQAKSQVYSAVADRFIELLKIYPKNEFLLLSLAQIYIKKLGDAPKAIFILNRMKINNVSIPMENSLTYLHKELGAIYLKANSKFEEEANYLSYFHYREKALWIKDKIRNEISEHVKLWKTLSEDPVDAKKIVEYSENICSLSKKIEHFWNVNFYAKERAYVNAPIIYGLYLEIIQGLAYAGIPLVQKAYEWLLHKSHIQRDVMDVSTGNSTVIVASIEPERLGQIIDASASVKNLFEVDKEHAIGSNIGIMMPNFIAKRHDRLIQRYHKAFTYDLNRHVKSYGKTVGDEYFGIEITLRVYPSVNKGLNLMAYLKKTSKSESLLIVNSENKIAECSRHLKSLLNLYERGTFISLSELCPELAHASEAFTVTHVPKETWAETGFDPQNFWDNDTHPTLSRTKPRESVFSLYKVPFASSRDLLRSYRDGEESPKTILRSEKNLLSEVYDPTPILSPKRNKRNSDTFPREEAEAICNTFKEGKRLKFRVSKVGKSQELTFETQIEPLVFTGEVYKIIKIKPVDTFSKILSYVPESVDIKDDRSDRFADSFPIDKENSEEDEPMEQKPQAKSVKILVNSLDKLDRKLTAKKNTPDTQKELFGDTNEANQSQPYKMRNMSVRTRTNSLASSKSGNVVKSLNQVFKTEKISYATRVSIILVYLAIGAVILSVGIDYFLTKSSLDSLEAAIGLIEVVNIRSFRTIFAWQAVLKMYSRIVHLEDNDIAFSDYQESIKEFSLEMLSSNLQLETRVDDFNDDGVTRGFFDKTISLWTPYKDVTLNFDKVDSFTANSIIYDYNIYMVNYQDDIYNLNNQTQALISINNTGNDYLLTVEDSISNVEQFFTRTKDSSFRILRLIVALENVALIMPFLSLVALFKVIIDSHTKLIRVVSKIQERSIIERMAQINSLARYLNENVEDIVVFYHDFKSSDYSKNQNTNSEAKAVMYQNNKQYKTSGLVWDMIKYLVFAFILVTLIIILFMIPFATSLNNFNELNDINQKTVTVYKLGEQVAMVLPTFYFLAIFQNDPKFRIRNDLPSNQLLSYIDDLSQANTLLISSLSKGEDGINDPYIEDLLKINLCDFVAVEEISDCNSVTNGGSIGLLGLNSKYYQNCALSMQQYLTDPSFADAQQFFEDLSDELTQIPTLLSEAYETLAEHLLETFRTKVEERKDSSLQSFFINLAAILVSMILIRIIIVKRYKELDIAVRKILKVIPVNIIERNKIFSYYLTKEFKKELIDVRGFA